jgi:hypothetical protein
VELPTFIWMFVILKIPIIAALWLIWYAIQEPEPQVDEERPGGGSDREPERGPRTPRPPRRGPHASPPPPAPARVRVARGRKITHRSG